MSTAEVRTRNIGSLLQAMEIERERADELHGQLRGLRQTVGTIRAELDQIRKQLVRLQIEKVGTGPTAG